MFIKFFYHKCIFFTFTRCSVLWLFRLFVFIFFIFCLQFFLYNLQYVCYFLPCKFYKSILCWNFISNIYISTLLNFYFWKCKWRLNRRMRKFYHWTGTVNHRPFQSIVLKYCLSCNSLYMYANWSQCIIIYYNYNIYIYIIYIKFYLHKDTDQVGKTFFIPNIEL